MCSSGDICKATWQGGCGNINKKHVGIDILKSNPEECALKCQEISECGGFVINSDNRCTLVQNGCWNDGRSGFTYYAKSDCPGKFFLISYHSRKFWRNSNFKISNAFTSKFINVF